MIRPLDSNPQDPWNERRVWNVEQPGARVTTDLQAENGPRINARVWAITDRVLVAEWRRRNTLPQFKKAGAA